MMVPDTNLVARLTVLAEDMHTRPTNSVNDLHIHELMAEYLAQDWPNTTLQPHHLDRSNVLVLRLRDALVEDGFYCVPVNQKYFSRKAQAEEHGNEAWPTTETQARQSIARGAAKAVGLHFHTGTDDLLFEAYVLAHTKAGAAKYAKNINLLIAAMADGTISVPRAGRIARAGERRLVIEDPDALRKAIKQAEADPLEIEG